MNHQSFRSSRFAAAMLAIRNFCHDFLTSCRVDRTQRQCSFESLEQRCVLSADGLPFDLDANTDVESNYTAGENTQDDQVYQTAAVQHVQSTITGITFRINGQERNLGPDGVLELNDGDQLEVAQIAVGSNAKSGVFAVEAYVNKISVIPLPV